MVIAASAWLPDLAGVPAAPVRWLPTGRLDDLIAALRRDGRRIVGPVITDGAIAMREIGAAAELPFGWTVDSAPGAARLRRGDGTAAERAFDNGPAWSGIKAWTFPARVDAVTFETAADGRIEVHVEAPAPQPLAIIGARACDLAALAIHDTVLLGGPATDPDYASRRADLFVVAVECALATSTCFCASMSTGPEVERGADVVLSELDGGFAARADSAAGERVLQGLGLGLAGASRAEGAQRQVAATRAQQTDGVTVEGLREGLLANLDHPRWDEIATRCLACGNCTLVCPTCFCTGIGVTSDLEGTHSSSARTWDSCFSAGFAQVVGGSFRPKHRDRYRQWLTHKFATWWDQFGTAGCVGCGRCVAWCPVGIDVREELRIIAGPSAQAATPSAATASAAPSAPAAIRAPLPMVTVSPPAPRRASAPLPAGYVSAAVRDIRHETADTVTLTIATDDAGILAARPGQFVMVAVPAFAIPPISISRIRPDGIELTIRAAGPATSFLAHLRIGAGLALRGPLGRPWPIEDAYGRDVAIVAGGIGLAPLRGLLDQVLAERDRFSSVRLYLGARTPRDRLFVPELERLAAQGVDIRTTVDRAGPEWLGRVGIITELFRGAKPTGASVTAFVCGPERMMTSVVDLLADLAVPPEHTWVTLERRMECGVGLCGHCQLGTRFVCRDGPVFSVAELGPDLRREGL